MKKTLKLSLVWAAVLLFGCHKPQMQQSYGLSPAASSNFNYQVSHQPAGKTDDVLPSDLFDNSITDSILSGRGLAYLDSTIQYYTDSASGAVLYTKRLVVNTGGSASTFDLFVASSNDNLANLPVLTETTMLESGSRRCKFSSFYTGVLFGTVVVDSTGHVTSINGKAVETSVGGTGGSQPCSETTSTYKACFKCAWGQLNDQAFGILTCSVNPVMCLMACGVACAAFPAPPDGHDPYTFSDIKSMADEMISGGKYNGDATPTGGKDFVFLY